MIAPITPSASYDPNNEAQFRTQVRQADISNLKNDQPTASFIMTDETDGAPYRVTLVSGALVFTAIVP